MTDRAHKELADRLTYAVRSVSAFIQDDLFSSQDQDAVRSLRALVFDTYQYVAENAVAADERRFVYGLSLAPAATIHFLKDLSAKQAFPDALMQRWDAWSTAFEQLLQRQPRLQLYYILQHSIGMQRNEWRLLAWIDSGGQPPPSVAIHGQEMDAAFFERLRAVRASAGGWISCPEDRRAYPVFVPEADIPQWLDKCWEEDRDSAIEHIGDMYSAFLLMPEEKETGEPIFRALLATTFNCIKFTCGQFFDHNMVRGLITFPLTADLRVLSSLCDDKKIPASLVANWRRWNDDYDTLLFAYPRQAFFNALSSIGTNEHRMGWPRNLIWPILDWIDNVEWAPPAFFDGKGVATPAFHAQLRDLQRKSGGWFLPDRTFVAGMELPVLRKQAADEHREKYMRGALSQVKEFLEWAPGEDTAIETFTRLCADCYDALDGLSLDLDPFDIVGYQATKALSESYLDAGQVEALTARWVQWRDEMQAITARHPLKELYDKLVSISESHTAAGWPSGYEWKIADWVDSGKMLPTPFDDRYNIITPEFFARLIELRRQCAGWFYENGSNGFKAVFLPEKEWRAIRAHQEAERHQTIDWRPFDDDEEPPTIS